MALIRLLAKDTIDKIAAGEVVEAPSSIVKELMENSIDAFSTIIRVEIVDGGITMIRVSDNGRGIMENDVKTAFVRHATSKLTTINDLYTLQTLGFRGEALSSIAAVSQVELITKIPDADTGFRYCVDGGIEKSFAPTGAPNGTSITVSNLFYNVPARKKFLKSPMTESAHVQEVFQRIALSHPEVAFTLTVNGQVKQQTAGDGELKNTIYSLFGRDIANNIIPIDVENRGMRISGYIGSPQIVRGNRSLELFDLNGRYFNDKVISRAIEDAYHPYMMFHKYPFTVFHIFMDPENADVNVHPGKMEVKFKNQRDVYELISEGVGRTLKIHESVPGLLDDNKTYAGTEASIAHNDKKTLVDSEAPAAHNDKKTFLDSEAPADYNDKKTFLDSEAHFAHSAADETKVYVNSEADSEYNVKDSNTEYFLARMRERVQAFHMKEAEERGRDEIEVSDTRKSEECFGKDSESTENKNVEAFRDNTAVSESKIRKLEFNTAISETKPKQLEFNTAISETKPEQLEFNFHRRLENKADFRIIGQLFGTYYLVELSDEFLLIDQHAAHEKVLYEEFCRKFENEGILPQMITPPIVVTLSLYQQKTYREHMEEIQHLGFEVESFGGDEFIISAVPSDFSEVVNASFFVELLDEYKDEPRHKKITSDLEHTLATMACKAAVKGNTNISTREMEVLIEKMLKAENPYNCPHGRPTMIKMTRTELEKKFKRVL